MFKTKFASVMVATSALIATGAHAVGTGIDFTVNEGVVAGAAPNTVVADSIDFSYEATISQTIVGAFDGVGDTFTETGNIGFSSFKNGILSPPSQLNSIPPAGYGIVGDFNATGNAAAFGGGIKAIFDTFNLNLFIDANQDGIGETALGSASIFAFSEANIFPGLANGDFDVQLLFTPTAFGSTFFIDPVPFILRLEVTGVTTTITGPVSLTDSFVAEVDGSGNAFFQQVPEPTSVALCGIALLGLGLARKKNRA